MNIKPDKQPAVIILDILLLDISSLENNFYAI